MPVSSAQKNALVYVCIKKEFKEYTVVDITTLKMKLSPSCFFALGSERIVASDSLVFRANTLKVVADFQPGMKRVSPTSSICFDSI
jgi:hypothetical protein